MSRVMTHNHRGIETKFNLLVLECTLKRNQHIECLDVLHFQKVPSFKIRNTHQPTRTKKQQRTNQMIKKMGKLSEHPIKRQHTYFFNAPFFYNVNVHLFFVCWFARTSVWRHMNPAEHNEEKNEHINHTFLNR